MHAQGTIVLFHAQQGLLAAMKSVAVNLTPSDACNLQIGRLFLEHSVSYRSLGIKLFQLHCYYKLLLNPGVCVMLSVYKAWLLILVNMQSQLLIRPQLHMLSFY